MEAKLTILVPEDLRRQAKAAVALRGTTLSEVVRAFLEQYIEEAGDLTLAEQVQARLAQGREALYRHDEVWAGSGGAPA
jgi:predicted DNA-binding protein